MDGKMLTKIIFPAGAMILALLFVFIPPISGVIAAIVPIVGGVAQQFGFKKFRDTYGEAKAWFQSKTLLGSLLIVIPTIALVVLPLFLNLPAWVTPLAIGIITAGGGNLFLGIVDAAKQEKEKEQSL